MTAMDATTTPTTSRRVKNQGAKNSAKMRPPPINARAPVTFVAKVSATLLFPSAAKRIVSEIWPNPYRW